MPKKHLSLLRKSATCGSIQKTIYHTSIVAVGPEGIAIRGAFKKGVKSLFKIPKKENAILINNINDIVWSDFAKLRFKNNEISEDIFKSTILKSTIGKNADEIKAIL